MNIENQIRRNDFPQVGYAPYNQVHAHSTGNPNSSAQNEADYHNRKDLNTGFYTHLVGNGRIIQVAPVGRGAYDVGGGWNYETYAAVELIESHSNRDEFMRDYKLYIDLLRSLADEAKIPKTLDTGSLQGIKTHNYCTNNQPNNGSDHVDPIPYLLKWGIDLATFRRDIENGFGGNHSGSTNNNTNSNTNNNTNSNTNNTNKKGKGEVTMMCLYERPINPNTGKLDNNGKATAVMFCNGITCKRLYHGDEINIVKNVYKANNGKDIPFYTAKDWNSKNPWYVRLEAVFPVK